MMRGWTAVYFWEMLILRRRLSRLIVAWAVSPLLYLVAFGYAIGKNVVVQEHSYLEFLIPGLVAMSSMTQAFAIGSEINIARFYRHIFEEFQTAPISNAAYVLGEVLAGMTCALLASCLILILGLIFGVLLSYNFFFWVAIILNSLVFSSLAVAVAMLIQSHADQALLNSLIITPMAFLGGTFFSLDHLPWWAQKILYLLPLTHAVQAARTSAFGAQPNAVDYFILAVIGSLAFLLAILSVNRARD
jgi:Nod factor-specific ABC transporter NodJ protein